jgi:uncharacterized membrane protein
MMLDLYRKKLLVIWCVGFLIPFVLLMIQFGNGKYGGKSLEMVGWLTSLTLSTILLMFGVMLSNPVSPEEAADERPESELTNEEKKRKKDQETKTSHEKFVFKSAVAVSVIYLLIINAVFFIEPLVSVKPQELTRDYKIFLAIFDSLLIALIGYFFGKK